MKVHQDHLTTVITPALTSSLNIVRRYRGFDVEQYVTLKAKLLNNYMKRSGLKTAVVALSGGVDSAVVFALCDYASRLESAFNVFPVTLPALSSSGVTNQSETVRKAVDLGASFGYEVAVISVGEAAQVIEDTVSNFFDVPVSNWAIGQLVPYTRTPFLYFLTSRFTDIGENAIIVGTTNRDEGAYLGYVGKASDGMVDVQLISDLHKSEVYKVGEYLNVTKDILHAVPAGDMYDGRADVEVFGAPYDYVEYLINELSVPDVIKHQTLKPFHEELERGDFTTGQYHINLMNLHKYNAHKYNIGSPAVHLDILPSGVKGGWKLDFENKYRAEMFECGNIIKAGFVSPVGFDNVAAKKFIEYYNEYYTFEKMVNNTIEPPVLISNVVDTQGIKIIDQLITKDEANMFIEVFNSSSKLTANVHGRLNQMDTEHSGSDRVSWYNVQLADLLFTRLNGIVDKLIVSDTHIIPGEDNAIYRAVGINPLMRFIGYNNGGMLVPHYDYPFVENCDTLSLYTLVIYLTDNETGATRFIKELNANRGKSLEDFTYDEACDFNQFNTDDCFIIKNKPKKLLAVLFPHYMLHDCEKVMGEHKLIIRTDVMYEKIKHS